MPSLNRVLRISRPEVPITSHRKLQDRVHGGTKADRPSWEPRAPSGRTLPITGPSTTDGETDVGPRQVAHWVISTKEAALSTTSDPEGAFPQSGRIDIDELFRNAPMLRTPHDLTAPEIFPDDAEFDEFLASVRTDRARDLS